MTVALASAWSARAAAEPTNDVVVLPAAPHDVKTEVPILAYTYQSVGRCRRAPWARKRTGSDRARRAASGTKVRSTGSSAAAITVWGSPVEEALTLIEDAPRDVTGNFAPSAAVVVRLFGHADDGFSMGLLGKFKVEGFGVGKNDEIESEIEGVLLGYSKSTAGTSISTPSPASARATTARSTAKRASASAPT